MGNARADIPVPSLRTPPLGGTYCPDPRWGAGKALVLSGPQTFLGAWQVLTAWAAGQPASSVAPPLPPEPLLVPEGAIPFVDVDGMTVSDVIVPPDDPGATVFADEVD